MVLVMLTVDAHVAHWQVAAVSLLIGALPLVTIMWSVLMLLALAADAPPAKLFHLLQRAILSIAWAAESFLLIGLLDAFDYVGNFLPPTLQLLVLVEEQVALVIFVASPWLCKRQVNFLSAMLWGYIGKRRS